jgi:hypothetical protein
VNKRSRCLFPIVRERASQVNLLRDLLRDLGLERRAKGVDVLQQIAQIHRQPPPSPPSEREKSETSEARPCEAPAKEANEAK